MRPKLLILDEPTSMLDPLAARNLLATVQRINRELGVAILMTEHRLDEVFPAADRVVTMDKGRILSDGAPAEIARQLSGSAEKSRIYFGLPAAVRIFSELEQTEDLPLTVRDGRRRLERLLPITVEASVPEIEKTEKEPKRPAVLEGKELWFRYTEKGKDILRGTDVTLREGELLCLLGGNGAGKTTLLQALANFKKPYRGKVKLAKGQRLCMLPQNARSLFVADTVEKELLDSAGQEREKAMQMAEKLELTPLLARHPYDLSGGEIQRLAVGKLLLLGIVQPVAYFIFENYGILYTSAAVAGTIIAAVPVCCILMDVLVLHERVTRRQVLCALGAIGGVALISVGGAVMISALGLLFLLLTMLSDTVYYGLSHDAAKRFTPFEMTYVMFVVGMAVFIPVALIQAGGISSELITAPAQSGSFWLAVLYLGILSSGVAYGLLNFANSHLTVSESSLFSNVTTVVSVLAGVLFLKEDFSLWQALGVVIILVCVFVANVSGGEKK